MFGLIFDYFYYFNLKPEMILQFHI